MTTDYIDGERHPIDEATFVDRCRRELDAAGVLVLPGFFTPTAIDLAVAESTAREREAYYARSTHNVYLTAPDATLPPDHPFNRQVASSKGLLADDQVPVASPLRVLYHDRGFRAFLSGVLGVDELHPYADALSSINVHFASHGQELGWHFDNSSFAVTMLLRAPEAGGVFEYARDVRTTDAAEFDRVAAVLDGHEPVERLDIAAGDLVLFRGRHALHRVTPTHGPITRLLVVFAFNAEPGVRLSDSALQTFYGRTA